MKKLLYTFLLVVLIPFIGVAQFTEAINYMSPFHDGFAAIKKGGEWAIINEQGTIVIDFRDDLVPLKMNDAHYPVFKNGRALIKQVEDDVVYYGYIDISGKTVIEPQFINALSFNHDKAIVIKLMKTKLGLNKVLDKEVVTHEYQELLIDSFGVVKAYLTEEKPISFTKPFNKIPSIVSEIVSENLVLTKLDDDRIILLKI